MRQEIERIEKLEGRPFDEIKVSASPFSRTISTCSQVAKGIGATHINLDYYWVEHLATWLYPQGDPLPQLEAR